VKFPNKPTQAAPGDTYAATPPAGAVRDLDADRPLLVTASAFLLVGDAKMLLEGRRILDK
jgi:hypothetical protein